MGFRRASTWVEGADVGPFLANHAHRRQARDVVVLGKVNRQNLALNLRRFVKRRFVSLVGEQVFAYRDPVPNPLVPLANHTTLDRLPLPEDIAVAMRRYISGKPADEAVWPGAWWRKSAEMLRRDLKAAGIKPKDGQEKGIQ